MVSKPKTMKVLEKHGRKASHSKFGNGFIYDTKSTGNRSKMEKRDNIILYKSMPQIKQSKG